jgi:hypothetical protein
MRFTDHTARLGLENLCRAGLTHIEEVETAELNSLVELISAELQDRDMRLLHGAIMKKFDFLKSNPF